jgi:hypothetical protein
MKVPTPEFIGIVGTLLPLPSQREDLLDGGVVPQAVIRECLMWGWTTQTGFNAQEELAEFVSELLPFKDDFKFKKEDLNEINEC